MKINSKWKIADDPEQFIQISTTCNGPPPPSQACQDKHERTVNAASGLEGQEPLPGTAISTWWEPPS